MPFHYDPVGRLLEESGFEGRTTRYQYDSLTGRLAQSADGERVISLSFDPLGRLTERRASLGDKSQSETFAYDGNGNLVMANNADSRLHWFHDPAGYLLHEHQHYLGLQKPTVAIWQHEYDVPNQRVATVRPDGHRVSWLTYGCGHLLGMRLDEHELIGYERDKANEIRRPLDLTPPRSKLVDNLLREYAGTHYDYDEGGNQIKRWGNGSVCEMLWDLFDRLVHFKDTRLAMDFAYDALGRRLHKKLARVCLVSVIARRMVVGMALAQYYGALRKLQRL